MTEKIAAPARVGRLIGCRFHSTGAILHMRKIFKLMGFLSAILCLFFVVPILAFYYLTPVGVLRRYLVDEIEKQTELKAQESGADIQIGWIPRSSLLIVA